METFKPESLAPAVELRQATDKDCELMFRLQHLDGRDIDFTNDLLAAEFESYKVGFDPSKIQVITVNNVAIGRLRIVRGDTIYIGGIQILPDYRKQKIGTSILSELINESRQTTIPITLEVFHNNSQAFELYRQIGFQITGEDGEKKFMRYGSEKSLNHEI